MDAKEILDHLQHVGIYVVDKETLITYYENPTAQKYSVKYRIGQPCYTIHGNLTMCESCPARKEDHLSYVNRTDLNMVFVMRSEEILWEGHPSWLISVAREGAYMTDSEDERAVKRMSRALQKSVDVYTEINMETMQYRQINLHGADCFNIQNTGDYLEAYEHMCQDEIHPEDAKLVHEVMAPARLQSISADGNGAKEISVRYRLKNTTPECIMESRAIFMRDELPHYVVSIARDVTEETRLREQANELELILDNVACGVAIYDVSADGTISMVNFNSGFCAFAEESKAALMKVLKEDPMYLVDEDYRGDAQKAFAQIITERNNTNIMLRCTSLAGTHMWVRLELSAVRNVDHTIRVYGTFLDITAEIELQQELQRKYELERNRSRDDESVLAYAVFDLQTHTTIEMERRNPFHVMPKKLSMEDFSQDIVQSVMRDDKKKEFEKLLDQNYLLEEHKNGIDEHSLEYQRRLPNGEIIWVKSSVHLIADNIKNEILLFYYCNDINTAKSLELMTSYMVDSDYDMLGCVNFADDTAIMLYGESSSRRERGLSGIHTQERYSESLNWFVNNAVVPEERKDYETKAFIGEIRTALSKNDSYEFVLHVHGKSGDIQTKKIRYTRYDTESEMCFFSQIDITDMLAEEEKKQDELRKALLAAKKANEAKTSFLSRMSHDMRTPMNGVLGLAALMKEEDDLTEIRSDLAQLEMSGKYLLQLINDTLDVSKIESGKMELHLKPIDSELVFGNILANAGQMAKEKGVQLSIQAPDIKHGEWVPVMADSSRLEQIVMNVLSNAIKFTPVGGLVEIIMKTVSITDEKVIDQYTIRDTGIGIGEEFLPHIYEAFAQEGRMHTNRENGTGLGMSIVKQLIELMGGTITINSKVNEGTEVTLVIPYPVCHEKAQEDMRAAVNMSTLAGKHILLCEDHPLNAQIATRLLERERILVEHAENGQVGVEMFQKAAPGHYDMVLMDIRMPVMNGLEAARAIRALECEDAKQIPIIAMTANAFDDDVQECMEAGMNDHMAKPIEPQLMFQKIAKNMK